MGSVAEMLVKIGAETSGLQRGLAQAGSQVRGFTKLGGGFTSMGSQLTRGLTLPIIAMGAYAAKSFGDAEQNLNTFKAVTGATAGEMKRASAEAKRLGNDVHLPGASAADAAQAMLELGKGGFTASQAMRAVRGTLLLATAAETDNATAATMVADSLHMFGMGANRASKAVDILAGTANASTAEISDVGFALQMAGTSAHQAGLSMQDTATAIGLMANAGIKGSDAGTSLKTMLMRLVPTTHKAKDAVHELGVDVFDAHGKMLPMPQVIGRYHDALAKLNPKQRATAINTIFGSDAQRAANIILGGGVKAWDKMHASVGKAGSAQQLANAKMKGLNGSIEAMKSSVQTAALVLGQALAPTITTVAHGVASLANWFSALSPQAQHTAATVALITAALGPLLIIIGKTIIFMARVRQAMVALGIVAAATEGEMTALGLAMEALPIIAIITAVFALGAALVIAYKRSATFRHIVNGAFNAVKSVAGAVTGFIRGHWQELIAFIPGIGPALFLVVRYWGRLRSGVASAVGTIKSLAGSMGDKIRSVANAAAGPLGKVAGFFGTIIDKVSSLVGWIGRIHWPSPPSWLSSLSSHIPGFASGTSFAPGGMALVGERGPELVNLPRGSSVSTAGETRRMLGGRSVNLTIVVTGNTMLARERETARELARLISPHLGRVVSVGP